MTDDTRTDEEQTETTAWPQDVGSVARRLEAVLLILDEPHSVVALAAAVSAPVPAVRTGRFP